jgi:hypothetical protein
MDIWGIGDERRDHRPGHLLTTYAFPVAVSANVKCHYASTRSPLGKHVVRNSFVGMSKYMDVSIAILEVLFVVIN